MLRPYLAVIKDSFRAALASFVLYAMLLLITLFLLALAPVGYQEESTTRIRSEDVVDPLAFITRVVEEGQKDKPSLERRVWGRLDESLQEQLIQAIEPPTEEETANPYLFLSAAFEARDSLIAALNEMIVQRDFYDETALAHVAMDDEASALYEEGLEELSDDETARFNRLMLESGFRGLLRRGPPTSIVLSYAVWDTGEALPVSGAELKRQVRDWLPFVLDKGLLSIGLLVGILVTAPIIPQTLEPGSISLLLSKPVSRTLLFLSKFVGGCAFMLLLSVYLIGGLWLILGIRLGLWSKELLLAIPLYVFVFATYYTVSAAAAVRWRNTIMAIVAAILFWGACSAVGWVQYVWRGLLDIRRIVTVIPAADAVAYGDLRGQIFVWNSEGGTWNEAFMTPEKKNLSAFERSMTVLPARDLVYDAQNDRLLCVRFTGMLGEALVSSTVSGEYSETPIGEAPFASAGIYSDADGNLIVLSRLGLLFRIDPAAVKKALESPAPNAGAALPPRDGGNATRTRSTDSTKGKANAVDTTDSSEERGDSLDATDDEKNSTSDENAGEPDAVADDDSTQRDDDAIPTALELYQPVGPEPLLPLRDPWVAAMNPDNGELAVYSRGTFSILAADEKGIYVERHTAEVEGIEPETNIVLGFSGESLVAGRPDGALLLIDRETLTVRDTFKPEESSRPLVVAAAPGGRWFAVLFSNRKLWLVDARDGKVSRPRVSGQGDISTVVFSGADELLVADRTTRVSRYQVDPLELEERMVGGLGFGEWAYRYAILPVYTIFPKPGETYKTIRYLLTRSDADDDGEQAPAAPQIEIERPWAPVWSGLIFMVAMLTITCVYIERQEY